MNHDHTKTRLLKGQDPYEIAVWTIYGEDSNCDFTRYHHESELETVHGTFLNVMEYALALKGFYTWGYGGKIVKSKTKKVKNIDQLKSPKVQALEKERFELQNRLKEIDLEMDELLK